MKKHTKAQRECLEGEKELIKELNIEAREKLVVRLCLTNSDQHKCGSMLKHLSIQRTLKSDQLPKNIVGGSILSNHHFDKSCNKSSKKGGKHNDKRKDKKNEDE